MGEGNTFRLKNEEDVADGQPQRRMTGIDVMTLTALRRAGAERGVRTGATVTSLAADTLRRAVRCSVLAVGLGLALMLLPGPDRHGSELLVAAAIGLGVVFVSTFWRSTPMLARLGAPILYVAFVAVLADSGGGTNAGYGGLFLLPLVWLAVVGSRAELLVGFAAVAAARALPVALVGGPDYPASTWRMAIVLGTVAAVTCLTIQRLIGDARRHAAAVLQRSSELEEAARILEHQNAQLQGLDRLKDEFVALVSHELRTPLTSIKGYIELLAEDAQSMEPHQHEYLLTVSRNAQRLETLVNDLLLLVQLDSGRLELNLSDADLKPLLVEATEAARPAARAKDIDLSLRTDALALVRCDPVRIAQVIDNLVTNAIKFTPERGRVEVNAAQNGSTIELTVSDTGIGIPAAEMKHLFGRFYRASSATDNGIPGTGLGLAISKGIADAHDAPLTVESTPGKGTTVQLVLSAAAAAN
jgi:signal transduction histidine kinase